jgi:hypothetical protein
MTFPGSCTALGARHRASPPDRPRPSPVARIVSHSRTAPAWETSPRPSADTETRYCVRYSSLESAFGW